MEPPPETGYEPARARVAIVQSKPHKGRYSENLHELQDVFGQLREDPPDLVVLPEAALTGYFLEGAVYELAKEAKQFAGDLAGAWRAAGNKRPVDLCCGFYENDSGTYYNSAVYLEVDAKGGFAIKHVHRKMFLPTYGVFDEERFLSRGRRLQTFQTRFGTAAMLICEDLWHSIMPTLAAVKGARLLLIPSAAPGRGIGEGDELGSIARWREIQHTTASEHGLFLLYASLAGFEGGKGMTGSSRIVDPRGRVVVEAPALGAAIIRATIDLHEVDLARATLPLLGDLYAVLPDLLLDDELPLPKRRPEES